MHTARARISHEQVADELVSRARVTFDGKRVAAKPRDEGTGHRGSALGSERVGADAQQRRDTEDAGFHMKGLWSWWNACTSVNVILQLCSTPCNLGSADSLFASPHRVGSRCRVIVKADFARRICFCQK